MERQRLRETIGCIGALIIMPGSRLFNFREGDRSEYLALYLLSGLGLVTQIPRQEDIGFDLVCSIADQESGRLTFNHQYLVSLKSKSFPIIELTPPESGKTHPPDYIDWVFRLDIPFILGVVDKDNCSISLYSTLPIWFIRYENPDCRSISLIPRINAGIEGDVSRPQKKNALPRDANIFHYDVDLGYPITTLSEKDLRDAGKLKNIKQRLRMALRFAELTILQKRIGVHNFYWFAQTSHDGSEFRPAFYYKDLPDDVGIQNKVFGEIAPTLVSLAMYYKTKKNGELLETVGKLLKLAPQDAVPDMVKQHLKEIYQ
jgi:hypothetical protein